MKNSILFALVSITVASSSAFAQQAADAPPRLVRSRVQADARLELQAVAQFPAEVDRQALLDHLVYHVHACDHGETQPAKAIDSLAPMRGRHAKVIYARALANLIVTERNLPYQAMKRAIRELGRIGVPMAGGVLRAVYAKAEVLAERLATPCEEDADGKVLCVSGWVPEDTEQIAAGYAHGLRLAVLDAAAALRGTDGDALLDEAVAAEQPSIRRHAMRHLRAVGRAR